MISILYFIVILIATLLGACAGLGGGVIIKPVLDFIGVHDLSTISFLSTSAVFAMALYSTAKQCMNKVKFDVTMILLLSVGSIFGGYLGSSLFSTLLSMMNPEYLKSGQAAILAILLIAVMINMKSNVKTLHVQNRFMILFLGLCLGLISSFLGIGGGPINVAVFIFFFSIDLKKATVYSIATILFTQISSLCTIAATTGFGVYDLSLLWFVIPAALLGGFIGTYINKRSSEEVIEKIFMYSVSCIILLTIYNAVSIFF